jgi:phytanoyl-CoA hydroxylase
MFGSVPMIVGGTWMDGIHDSDDWVHVPDDLCARQDEFMRDGFVVSPFAVLSQEAVHSCRAHLQAVLDGVYDTGALPTKVPKFDPRKLDRNDKRRKTTLQIINIRHCDSTFNRIVHSPALGRLVATLAGWSEGARVAQDQIWAKPAGAQALTFHRDTPYFAFVPNEVVTVWITFDDLSGPDAAALGPLEYYPGSHRWTQGRNGIATQFFDRDYKAHLKSAAERQEGAAYDQSRIVQVVTPAGGLSVHDGRTWHGSGPNESQLPRRGIGIHYVRANVVFQEGWLPPQWEAVRSKHNEQLRRTSASAADAAVDAAMGQVEAVEGGTTGGLPVDATVPEWECPVVWRPQ